MTFMLLIPWNLFLLSVLPCAPLGNFQETQFGSETKESFILWSENGEVGAPALGHRLSSKGHGWGSSVGTSSARRKVEFQWGRCSCAAQVSRSQCWGLNLCTRPATAILNCFSTQSLRWAQLFHSRNSHLKVCR